MEQCRYLIGLVFVIYDSVDVEMKEFKKR